MYVSFEGPEATGKTTQIELLASRLREEGHKVFVTKEPGSPADDTCKAIRNLLLHEDFDITDETALFMFLADRSQHIQQVIKPALDTGHIVLCDRGSLTTLFYYLAAQEPSNYSSLYASLNGAISFAQTIKPDHGFIFNAKYKWIAQKLSERNKDRIEKKGDVFHKRVRDFFADKEHIFNLVDEQKWMPSQIEFVPEIPDASLNEVSDFIYVKIKDLI